MLGLGQFHEGKRVLAKIMNRSSYVLLVLAAVALVGLLLYSWRGGQASTPAPAVRSDSSGAPSISTAAVQPSASPGNHDQVDAEIPFSDTAAIPPRYQLPGITHARTADSFDAWMEQFPPDDRKRIEAFADRYYGVYEIASAKQIAWMAQVGYPMPEDLIAAAKMTDAELQDLASKGNTKAKILWSDRQLTAAVDKLKQLDPNSPEANDARSSTFSSLVSVLNSDTPFKGYLEAADGLYLQRDADTGVAYITAGLLHAASLGDTRAADVLSDYADAGVISDQAYAASVRLYTDLGGEQIRLRSLENCPLTKSIPTN